MTTFLRTLADTATIPLYAIADLVLDTPQTLLILGVALGVLVLSW